MGIIKQDARPSISQDALVDLVASDMCAVQPVNCRQPDSRLGQVLVLRVYEDDDGAQEQRWVWRWIWRAGTAPTCARQCHIDARSLLVLAALCGRVSLGIARDTEEPGIRTLSVAVRTCCRFRRRWVEPSACERVRGSRLVVK